MCHKLYQVHIEIKKLLKYVCANFCRYKAGDLGSKQAEPRLELKKHRRVSRKRLNQSILDELNELDDLDEGNWTDVEEGAR